MTNSTMLDLAEHLGISPLLTRTTDTGVEERVHVAVASHVAPDGTVRPAHVSSTWLPEADGNRLIGGIADSAFGEPLGQMRMSPDAPHWAPQVTDDEIAMWRDRVTAVPSVSDTEEYREFDSRYRRDVHSYAGHVSKYNLYDFDVVIEDGSSRRVSVHLVDRRTSEELEVLTEDSSIGIGLYAGTVDFHKMIANLATKADYIRRQGSDYTHALLNVVGQRLNDWAAASAGHYRKYGPPRVEGLPFAGHRAHQTRTA